MRKEMRIVRSKTYKNLEQMTNNREFISSILKKIILICNKDNNFSGIKKQIDEVNDSYNNVKEKIDKQDKLIETSKSLKKECLLKIEIIDRENDKMKNELLESLGNV
jgi:hypothetical protein